MRPPLRERIKQAICRRFGHREDQDDWVIFCGRCRLVLRSKVWP